MALRTCLLNCDACRVRNYAHAAPFDSCDQDRNALASGQIAFKNRIELAKRSADDPHVLPLLERPPGNLYYSVPAAGANVIDNSLRNGEQLAARRYEAANSRQVANLEIVRGKPKSSISAASSAGRFQAVSCSSRTVRNSESG